MAELKDSGARREFETGAVRDIAEGKGRCDLLPLSIVAQFINDSGSISTVLSFIELYVRSGNTEYLCFAIKDFAKDNKIDVRTLVLEVSKHYEDGARKYSERNWEKGLPLHCFIDSGVRHYIKFLRGDNDEPHDRAFVWNMIGAMWTQANHPHLIDLPFNERKCEPAVTVTEFHSTEEEESNETN